MLENAHQLREHRGPYFDHWRRRTLAAFGIGVSSAAQGSD